jgi:hypothetical protein
MTSRKTSFVLPLLALLAGPDLAAAAQSRALVYTTDFSTGSLSSVNLNSRAVTPDVEPAGSDAVLRWYGASYYVVNRFGGDNVQVVNDLTLDTSHQFSTGNGSNPQDICFVSPAKAYVTRYERNDILIVNPATGASPGVISLAAFADADGLCEMARMVRVDRYLFVALQRLDRNAFYGPTDSSLVAVIDTDTDSLVDVDPAAPGTQAILLTGKNPVTTFEFDRATSRLLIGCAGFFGALDGGIEWIDPVNFTSLGFAVTEAALGGDIGDVVWRDDSRSYAIVADASFNTLLVAWNGAGQNLGTIYAPGGYSLTDAALNDRDELYVCNNNLLDPGLHVFAGGTGAPLAGPLDCGLPPHSVSFDATSEQVLAVPAEAALGRLAPPTPNPAVAFARLKLSVPVGTHASVVVYDALGRHVRTLLDGASPAETREMAWDLRDAGGRAVPAGLYLVRARIGGVSEVRRLAVTR